MRRIFFYVIAVAWLLALSNPWEMSPELANAQATSSPNPPCGTPNYLPSPGGPANAGPMAGELNHLETCAASAAVGGLPPSPGTCITVVTPQPVTINMPCAIPTITSLPGMSAAAAGGIFSIGLLPGTCLATPASTLNYTCATPGPQATPSPTPTFGTLVTGSWPYTIGLDQSISPTWTGSHTWVPSTNVPPIVVQPTATASASPCPGFGASTPAPQAVLCIGPYAGGSAASTTIGGIVLGKTAGTGWGGTVTANSAPIQFVRNNGSADVSGYLYYASGGTLTFSNFSAISTAGTNITIGAGTATIGKMNQNADGDFAGHCAMSNSSSCTFNLVAAYGTNNCVASPNTASPVSALSWGVTVSSTTVTVTATANNSFTWWVHCFGDPT